MSNPSSRKTRLPEPGPDGGRQGDVQAACWTRCLVQRMSAPGEHRLGRAATVVWMFAAGDVAEDAPHAHHHDLGGDRARTGIGDAGVGLQDLEGRRPARPPHRLPRQRTLRLVVAVSTSRVPFARRGYRPETPDHIPALPGAQADQPYVLHGGMIEDSTRRRAPVRVPTAARAGNLDRRSLGAIPPVGLRHRFRAQTSAFTDCENPRLGDNLQPKRGIAVSPTAASDLPALLDQRSRPRPAPWIGCGMQSSSYSAITSCSLGM